MEREIVKEVKKNLPKVELTEMPTKEMLEIFLSGVAGGEVYVYYDIEKGKLVYGEECYEYKQK